MGRAEFSRFPARCPERASVRGAGPKGGPPPRRPPAAAPTRRAARRQRRPADPCRSLCRTWRLCPEVRGRRPGGHSPAATGGGAPCRRNTQPVSPDQGRGGSRRQTSRRNGAPSNCRSQRRRRRNGTHTCTPHIREMRRAEPTGTRGASGATLMTTTMSASPSWRPAKSERRIAIALAIRCDWLF